MPASLSSCHHVVPRRLEAAVVRVVAHERERARLGVERRVARVHRGLARELLLDERHEHACSSARVTDCSARCTASAPGRTAAAPRANTCRRTARGWRRARRRSSGPGPDRRSPRTRGAAWRPCRRRPSPRSRRSRGRCPGSSRAGSCARRAGTGSRRSARSPCTVCSTLRRRVVRARGLAAARPVAGRTWRCSSRCGSCRPSPRAALIAPPLSPVNFGNARRGREDRDRDPTRRRVAVVLPRVLVDRARPSARPGTGSARRSRACCRRPAITVVFLSSLPLTARTMATIAITTTIAMNGA